MTDLRELQFYSTPDHSCSYLDKQQAKTLFVDPKARISLVDYSVLSDLGFRRSGNHIYRPHCDGCSACISARLPVDLFKPSKSQKRVLQKNRDITLDIVQPVLNDEIYHLYERYISARHQDGDMYPPSRDQFLSFLVKSDYPSNFYLFKKDNRLLAVSVVDRLEQGLSAIYTFFDPEEEHRSLGRLAILKQIEAARNNELPYLYLGYWIKGCAKMSYKVDYLPIELLVDGHWTRFDRKKP